MGPYFIRSICFASAKIEFLKNVPNNFQLKNKPIHLFFGLFDNIIYLRSLVWFRCLNPQPLNPIKLKTEK